MIAQLQGQHFTLKQICQLLPGRPNVCTVWRWINKGCRGHRLASVRVGGINYVAERELERFLSAINGGSSVKINSAAERAKQLAKVDRDLDRELA